MAMLAVLLGVFSSAWALQPPVAGLPAALRRRLSSYPSGPHPAFGLSAREAAPPAAAGASSPRCNPMDFGGDPTGKQDSAPALQQCIQLCINYSATIDFLGHFPGDYSFKNGHYIANAGGCEVDLGGGEYKLSAPILIPEYIGNMRIGHGSLVADPTPGVFPPGSFLIVVGVEGSCKVPQGSCNVDLGFPELFLDGSHVASGLQVNNVMGTTVGPGGYFLNFSSYGLQINQGHEVMMDRCWLGETNFDFPFSQADPPKAVAIQVNGNDHFILNTIVFSSKVGLEVNGAANNVQNVHVWFPDNQALAFVDQGVKAFSITSGGNRFHGCYIDGGRAVFSGSALSHNIWTNGFECCANVPGVTHGIMLQGNAVGPGLIISNNIFGGGTVFSAPVNNQTAVTVSGVSIESNSFSRDGAGTRATLTATATGQTQFFFDFCPLLVFPTIATVDVSVVAASGFPRAVARPPQGCNVTVETDGGVTGFVTVTVDSSTPSPNFI